MAFQTKLFINNEYVSSTYKETIDVFNPNDESLVVKGVQIAGEQEIDSAVEAATAAFKPWSNLAPSKRAGYMFKLADLIEANAERLAKLESVAMGQPLSIALMMVSFAAQYLRYYAGYVDKLPGKVFPHEQDGTYKIVEYSPLGVCSGIAAWNFTFVYIGWKIAPAIAAGNTYIFKTSEKSPLGALAVGELIVEAGFPPGVINLVSGAGLTGALLASHMKIAKIAFTGSTATGRRVQDAATKSNLKKVSLELGGKSASVVFDDADLEIALKANSQDFLLNSGQVCFAKGKVLVQDTIAEKFISGLKGRFEALRAASGDPLNKNTFLGPLADRAQFERVMSFISEGKKDNLEFVAGGNQQGSKGYFVEPTLIANPPRNNRIYTDEVFGPILTISIFKTEEEAIELANDTPFGLSASVYTSDIVKALRVSRQLEAGTIGINTSFMPALSVPFGGVKQSGYGRESGEEGIKAYLETKTISIFTGAPSN